MENMPRSHEEGKTWGVWDLAPISITRRKIIHRKITIECHSSKRRRVALLVFWVIGNPIYFNGKGPKLITMKKAIIKEKTPPVVAERGAIWPLAIGQRSEGEKQGSLGANPVVARPAIYPTDKIGGERLPK